MISVRRPVMDLDAMAFGRAAGVNGFNELRSIHQIAVGFKTNNVWSNSTAVYPMTGGAYASSLNLKKPINSDLAFRITWTASPIFSPRGIGFNGSTQFGDTKLTPSISLSNDSVHIGYYSRTNNAAAAVREMGSKDPATAKEIGVFARFTGDLFYPIIIDTSGALYPTAASIGSSGFFIATRITTSTIIGVRNGSTVVNSAQPSTTGIVQYSVYIGAENNGGSAISFTNRQCAFASIGNGLTTSQADLQYRTVQQAQMINYGRQV